MRNLPLLLNPENWDLFIRRRADKEFQSTRDKIFVRDKFACQFCGFEHRQGQEIINLDHNYRNNAVANLVTACSFCAQCLFVDSVGRSGFGGGRLIFLPELTQAQLNSFCHVLFHAIAHDPDHRNNAQSLYRSLKLRTHLFEDKFGEGTSNPTVFSQLLFECSTTPKKLAAKVFATVRLLPSHSKFKNAE